MLVTVGTIQSNHTRQTATAAAKSNLKCALLHCAWTKDAGPDYRRVGNILLSNLMGAELYLDEVERPIEDQGPLDEFMAHLRSQGHNPYLIPGGASEHPLGSMGYINCAIELAEQMNSVGVTFDYLVHTTGSSSTQAGLLAGFKALGIRTHIIGVADDGETEIKRNRVEQLANDPLAGEPPLGGPGKLLVHDGSLVHWDECFGCWRSVAKRAVRPDCIVVSAPLLNEDLSLAE